MRCDYGDAGVGPHVQSSFRGSEHGLFEDKHAPVAREPCQQVLRPLIDEVPTPMREAEQVLHCSPLRSKKCTPVVSSSESPLVTVRGDLQAVIVERLDIELIA